MRRRLRMRRRGSNEPTDINITAFMNLMVILVPFLLITAVFSRMTILELNLPAASEQQAKQQFELEVIVRKGSISIGDRQGGLIKRIASLPEGHDFSLLSDVLKQVKSRYPEKVSATLLLEANTSYETLVATMDAVRVVTVVQAGSVQTAELFPEISIGDAPLIKVASK